jgi:hypothetical protein
MNNSSEVIQMGNITFKGSTIRELAVEIQNEIVANKQKTDFFQVKYSNGENEFLPVREEDFEARTNLKKDIATRVQNIHRDSKKLAKSLLMSAISYQNIEQNGKVIFQSQSFEDMESRNLIKKNMKFNHEKISVLPDNTLLIYPSILCNIGL